MILFALLATWLLYTAFDVTFVHNGLVWRDSNRSEGSAVQLFDRLLQDVAINIKLTAFV